MNTALTVFFNTDRTYFALVEPGPKGLVLKYLNATEHPVDLEDTLSETSAAGIREINEILPQIPRPDKVYVSLPQQNMFISRIPGNLNMSKDHLKKLVEFEIHGAYPQFNSKDFTSIVVELGPKLDKQEMLLVEIIPNNVILTTEVILAPLELPIECFDVSQMNIHSALLYNYPEEAEKAIAVMSFQDQFIDLSVIVNRIPIYYSLIKFNSPSDLPNILEEEFGKLMTDYIDYIETDYLCGSALTNEIVDVITAKLADFLMFGKRCNAFRMVSPAPELSQRMKDYCSRTQHIFSACIGAAIPPYHKRIVLQ